MKELSLHILDIVQNSIHAKATVIEINITENLAEDIYRISMKDNGTGMDEQTIEQVLDPFFTTKQKKTGLGIPLFKQHAEMTDGHLEIFSTIGEGTKLTATFGHKHFDRQPLGDIADTMAMMIRSNPEIDFLYKHIVDSEEFVLSTKEIKETLDGLPITTGSVIDFIKEMINDNLKEIGANN